MEKLEKVHPVLEGIIMDAALKAVDALLIKVSLKMVATTNVHVAMSTLAVALAIHFVS